MTYHEDLLCLNICIIFFELFQTAYSVITYAGYVGVLSGQKPYGFTITVDERGLYFLQYNLHHFINNRDIKS